VLTEVLTAQKGGVCERAYYFRLVYHLPTATYMVLMKKCDNNEVTWTCRFKPNSYYDLELGYTVQQTSGNFEAIMN
jgi:hypothetical protein